jgi:hypothetical protein
MSTITKNEDTKAYDIDVPLDWSDLMLINHALEKYQDPNNKNRTCKRIETKLNELNTALLNNEK